MTNDLTGADSNFIKRILVVDDHSIVRQGLKLLIEQEPDLKVCATAENTSQALDRMKEEEFDLAIVDITLNGSNGLNLTETLKEKYPELPVLILTMHEEELYAKRAFRSGANGFVTKHEAAETIITAIRLILSGKDYISEGMTQKLLRRVQTIDS